MSTTISRLYNWVTDKANSVKITASRQDGELDQIIVALNRKVLCSGSSPSSPIAGQTWVDTTNKLLKLYRNNEWVVQGVVHVGTSAPATPQEGDLWWDSTNNLLYVYNGSSQVLIPQGQATNYRDGLNCVQASSTTITVGLGTLEVNGTIVSKTAATTLTLTTAGDWAGGSSLQATATYGFVGVDVSGNVKMHTTAPTHSNFAVSNTNGKKRYATWSSTVYRIIGWFYMNSTGSGELFAYEVGNLKDGGVANAVENATLTDITLNDTSYGTDMDATTFHFYSTGRPVVMSFRGTGTAADVDEVTLLWDVDGTDKTTAETSTRYAVTGGNRNPTLVADWQEKISQGTHTLKVQGKVTTSTLTITNWFAKIEEL